MKLIWITIIAFFAISSLAFAEENKNYCHDPQTWVEWDNLIKKNPGNMDIHFLHAVRIGLCRKVDEGTISFDKATEIFNDLHVKVYKKAKLAQDRHKEMSEL